MKISRILIASLLAASTFAPLAHAQEAGESLVIQQYRRALELDPVNIDINYQLAIALLREKKYAESLEYLNVVYGHSPDDPEVSYYMGLAFAGLGELERAIEAYARLDSIERRTAIEKYELDKVYYNIGVAWQKRENPGAALGAYEKSINIKPEQALAWCRKGELLFELRDFRGALESFNICEQRQPNDSRVKRYMISARLSLGLRLLEERNYKDALKEFKEVSLLDPKNENAVYFQGYSLYQSGDYVQALLALERLSSPESREIYDNLPALLQNIGLELHSIEDWDYAEKAFKKALEFRQKDADLHFLLAYTYLKKNLYRESLDEINTTLRLNPEHSRANLVLAIATERLVEEHIKKGEVENARGNYAEALQEFNTVLEIDAKNQRGLKGKRDVERNLELLRYEVSKKREEEVRSKLASGEKALKEGKYRDALLSYRYVLAIDPNSLDARKGEEVAANFLKESKDRHSRKGDQYAAELDFHQAIIEYRNALGVDPEDPALHSKIAAAEARINEKTGPFLKDAARLEERGLFEEAVKKYEDALRYDPENLEAKNGRSRAFKAMGNRFSKFLDKARENFEDGDFLKASQNLKAAEELSPKDGSSSRELSALRSELEKAMSARMKTASSALNSGRFQEAADIYEEALSADPSNSEAESGLKRAREEMAREAAKKLKLGDEAFRQERYQQAYQLYGEALSIDRSNKTARSMREEARKKLDDSLSVSLKTGVAAYNRGEMDSAALEFRRVLNADSSNQTAKKYLSLIEKSRAKGSDKDIEKLYLRGIELYTEGRYVDAIKSWEKVLEREPRHEKAILNIEKAKRKLEGVMDVK